MNLESMKIAKSVWVADLYLLCLFTVSFTGHRPAQRGSARTELMGPSEMPLPPDPKDQTRPAHRELHALLHSFLKLIYPRSPEYSTYHTVIHHDHNILVYGLLLHKC